MHTVYSGTVHSGNFYSGTAHGSTVHTGAVHSGTVYNSKYLEPTQMPINDRLDKENVAHIHHGILCSHKNDEFVSSVGSWMNMETIILSKLMQEQKTKHHMF